MKLDSIILLSLMLAVTRADAAVSSVAAGSNHNLALISDGTVRAWGDNSGGELGDGTTTQRNSPVQVIGLAGVVAVAAGHSHSIAVKSDGTVWNWGSNESGDLGDGTTTQRNTPVQVSGLAGVVAVAAGYSHSLAVRSNGTVWAWGDNASGELGDGTTNQRNTPVQVSGLTQVVGVSAGDHFSLAVRSDGTVMAWGINQAGELGNGITTLQSNTPVQVTGLTAAVAVAAGAIADSLALKSDGSAWAWGSLVQGGGSNTPVQVNGLAKVTGLSTGGYFNLAVTSDGNAWGWGNNGCGELGDGTTTNRNTPVQVRGLNGPAVAAVAAGFGHSLALRSDGTVWAWGCNLNGQLGNGTTVDSFSPVQVIGLPGAVGVISINSGGIVNSASSVPGVPVAPGSLASVYGSFPIAGTSQADVAPWPTSLSGLSIQIGGIPAPLYYASATQVNVQIPWELVGLT
jgi:alpha-tubulin suppressor-like RCC1 family protein